VKPVESPHPGVRVLKGRDEFHAESTAALQTGCNLWAFIGADPVHNNESEAADVPILYAFVPK
jgi:hypothetical protein